MTFQTSMSDFTETSAAHTGPVSDTPTGTGHAHSFGSPSTGAFGPSGQRWMPPLSQTPITGQDERNWAMGAHLSAFVAAWFALGFLGPLTVLLLAGPRSAFVRRHAVEALNFNLSTLLYVAISTILMIVLIGFPMLLAVGVTYLVFVIIATVAASRGEDFRYPMSIRFVK